MGACPALVTPASGMSGGLTFSVIEYLLVSLFAGVLLVYLIIIGDLLVGTEETGYNGLVSTVLNTHNGDKWYASRWFVVRLCSSFQKFPLLMGIFYNGMCHIV